MYSEKISFVENKNKSKLKAITSHLEMMIGLKVQRKTQSVLDEEKNSSYEKELL